VSWTAEEGPKDSPRCLHGLVQGEKGQGQVTHYPGSKCKGQSEVSGSFQGRKGQGQQRKDQRRSQVSGSVQGEKGQQQVTHYPGSKCKGQSEAVSGSFQGGKGTGPGYPGQFRKEHKDGARCLEHFKMIRDCSV
jgi:hypothetical protein